MRRLLGFGFLLIGCCFFQAPADPVAKFKPEPTTMQSIFGFTEADMKIPDLIPTSILADPNFYYINVRVIIEGQPVRILQNGKTIEGVWWARKLEDVRRDFDQAEKIYEDVGVKFHIGEVSFKERIPDVVRHFVDANTHPNQISVVYMLPNVFKMDGYSSFPWELTTRGIVIHYLSDGWTVSHEIGHYFGLLHTFNEDYVSDTPIQFSEHCMGGEFSTPNCHNIMSYCEHMPKYATPGQLVRFKRFLRAKRINHYVRDSSDLMLRGHTFLTPSGTDIFDLDLQKNP